MFRDPINQLRRFIPLRLDDAEIKDVLKQFAHVDWRQKADEEYAKLLATCRPAVTETGRASEQKDQLQLRPRPLEGKRLGRGSGAALRLPKSRLQ